MKQNKKVKRIIYIALLALTIPLLTGCVQVLRDGENNAVRNPDTGQNLTGNIICQPTEEDVIELYKTNDVDISDMPDCNELSFGDSEYDGIWYNFFVKPLAVGIMKITSLVGNVGLAVIIAGLIIRLIAMPVTKKIAVQSENTKKAKPELDKLEKKYKDKKDTDSMMKKNQEMSAIYKKYNINPVVGCLFAGIQLPIFLAFYEAMNRVPAIFEGQFLTLYLGMTPLKGLQTGNFIYILLIVLLVVTTYYSFNFNRQDMSGPAAGMFQSKGMIYGLLGFMTIIGFNLPTAILLYWITSSGFTIGQNLYLQRGKEKPDPEVDKSKDKKKGKQNEESIKETKKSPKKKSTKKGGKK
jgi:YidC/Oxa1 family membrane protein insertase